MRFVSLAAAGLALLLLLPGPASARTIQASPGDNLGRLAKNLKPGDTLVLAEGEYRDAIMLPKLKNPPHIPTTITAAEGARVVIKGSDVVTGWSDMGGGRFVKSNWDVNSQQVFVDGRSLQQVAGVIIKGYPLDPNHQFNKLHKNQGGIWPGRLEGDENTMPDWSFYYDMARKRLYVQLPEGETLDGKLVEVSVRMRVLEAQGWDYLAIKDLEFEHSNTSDQSRQGAILLLGNHLLLQNLELRWPDLIGITMRGDDNTLLSCTVTHAGQIGLVAKGERYRIIGCVTNYNNVRKFNVHWAAGGSKFVGFGGLGNSVVAGHTSLYNQGDGIWFDWNNRDNLVCGCLSAYNVGLGIHYEASFRATIINNLVYGNTMRGIYLQHSSGCLVAHNLVAFNGMTGIVVIDTGRQDPKGVLDLRPNNNRVYGNIVAWNNPERAALVFPDDMKQNDSDYNLFVDHRPYQNFSQGWPRGRPWIAGLDLWSSHTGLDTHSIALRATPTDALVRQIKEQAVIDDWSELLLTAERMPVSPRNTLPGVLGVGPGDIPVGPLPEGVECPERP